MGYFFSSLFFSFLVILAQSAKGQRSTRVFSFFPFCSDFSTAIVFSHLIMFLLFGIAFKGIGATSFFFFFFTFFYFIAFFLVLVFYYFCHAAIVPYTKRVRFRVSCIFSFLSSDVSNT